MRSWFSFLFLAVLGLALARAVPPARGAEGERGEAVAAAKTVLDAARKAPKGDAETLKALRAARTSLEPFAGAVRSGHWDPAKGDTDLVFARTWNGLLTVSSYHGVDVKDAYVLDRHAVLWGRYHLGLPPGGAWSWRVNTNAKNADQLHMFVEQKRPGGALVRQIKVWTYRWDTTYDGVGGENYKGLAKMMHEVDRDSTGKAGRKLSGAITPKRLNGEFSRVYYYFVEGFDVDEEKRLRRDNYYMKGDELTFNFEVIAHLDPAEDDDEVTKWQRGEGDPEIAAVLASLVSNPGYGKKK